MKLTWFGNSAFRIHMGGQIVVVDANAAPDGVDAAELVSGADHVVGMNGNLAVSDLRAWRPRPRERLLDAGDQPRPVQIWSWGDDCLLLDADDDRQVLIIVGTVPQLGRWVQSAVVVLVGKDIAQRGARVVEQEMPRLIALAGDDSEVDAAFAQLPALLDGTSMVALEPGLALEV